MQILFFASIRGITGEKEIRWTTPTSSLGDLLREMSTRYGPAFQRWVLEGEELGKSVLIQINGHDARHEGGMSAALKPDDVIAIFPAIAGGLPSPSPLPERGERVRERGRLIRRGSPRNSSIASEMLWNS